MSQTRYPNESKKYREARDKLLKEEQKLVDQVKAVAEKRRKLPTNGELKEDYAFEWAVDGKVGNKIKFSDLFGDKDTLILYSFMYGPSWGEHACPSCTSLIDGFDRTWYQVTQSGAALVAIAKASPQQINTWAKRRGWTQIPLVSSIHSTYPLDYKCQDPNDDDMQWPMMHVFKRRNGKISHFWGSELTSNHIDTVWPYWNLMDFTPQGRPDMSAPPQDYVCEFLESLAGREVKSEEASDPAQGYKLHKKSRKPAAT